MGKLSLHLDPTFLPSTITDFLNEMRSVPSAAVRAARIDNFVRRLEDEMGKIDAFKRELPLCMILLRDVIKVLKEESIQNLQIALPTTGPVLEEFIPLRKGKDEDEPSKIREKETDFREKKNWMSSVQLWNADDHSSSSSLPNRDLDPQVKKSKEKMVFEFKDRSEKVGHAGGGESFRPFKRHCTFPSTMKENKMELTMKNPIEKARSGLIGSSSAAPAAQASLNSSVVYTPQSMEQQQDSRKQRRCWAPDLHSMFISALGKLGGEKVATPKQIREVMKVDGLTNDEVKSHLQKYRIHSRKLQNNGGSSSSQGNKTLSLENLQNPNNECSKPSKASNSQSMSPEGPLHLALNSGVTTSTAGGDSIEEDEKSESHSWKKPPLSRNNGQ